MTSRVTDELFANISKLPTHTEQSSMGIKHKSMNKCPNSVREKSIIQAEKNDTYKEPMHA